MRSTAALQVQHPFLGEFAEAVLDGLSRDAKSIPCRFLYDARGSELFEQITRLPEYYPTRTEIGLLQRCAADIARLSGPGCALVEFGSGSSRKTGTLIDRLEQLAAYVPIDISHDALHEAADRLAADHPGLTILPVHADFNNHIALPDQVKAARKLGFFPGSTIGNFGHDEAKVFLADAARLLGPGSAILVGVDLDKDAEILVPAYDDAQGVTAAFILNLLHRINRELDGDFDVSAFALEAIYNAEVGRMEIYIVSLADQQASVLGQTFGFSKGERIHAESSYKYGLVQFQDLARESGWRSAEAWTDDRDLFSLHYLTRD